MGTHPIFESDFDCLTVMRWIIYSFARKLGRLGSFPPTFPGLTPALASTGLAQGGHSTLAQKFEEALNSRIDFHSSNEKGRTQRMAAFAAKNRELAKIKEKELNAKREAQKAEMLKNKKPLRKASGKQLREIKKKWK